PAACHGAAVGSSVSGSASVRSTTSSRRASGWHAATTIKRAASSRMSGHQSVGQQRLPHLGSRLPPRFARFGESLHHGIAQDARDVAPQFPEVGGGRVLLHVEHGGGTRGGERRPAREGLEQYDA